MDGWVNKTLDFNMGDYGFIPSPSVYYNHDNVSLRLLTWLRLGKASGKH